MECDWWELPDSNLETRIRLQPSIEGYFRFAADPGATQKEVAKGAVGTSTTA
jgi:hypothetical protein